jgi:hypothetical protein
VTDVPGDAAMLDAYDLSGVGTLADVFLLSAVALTAFRDCLWSSVSGVSRASSVMPRMASKKGAFLRLFPLW